MRCEHRWGTCLWYHRGHMCERYHGHGAGHRCRCGAECMEG